MLSCALVRLKKIGITLRGFVSTYEAIKTANRKEIDNNLFLNLHKQLFAIYLDPSNEDANHKFT